MTNILIVEEKIRFIFIGGTLRGYKVIESLIRNGNAPSFIFVLKEDQHELEKYSGEIIKLAELENIPFKLTKKLNKEDEIFISSSMWDFAIVCGWRTIINPDLDQFFKLGFLAAHDSLLPKYRGFAPINWALINGEKKTGVTLFKIEKGDEDSGPILGQEEVNIGENEYAYDVYLKVCDATIRLINAFILNYKSDSIELLEQNEELATYGCARGIEDGRINFEQTSVQVLQFVKALAPPYPGAFFIFNEVKYIVTKAVLGVRNNYQYAGRIPGKVIMINSSEVEVLCKEGSILFKEILTTDGEVLNPKEKIKSIRTVL